MQVLPERRPRIIVFSGKHHPLEPLSTVADALRSAFSPEKVFFMKFPRGYTPLGEALENYKFLAALSRYLVEQTSGKQQQAGHLLIDLIHRVRDQAEEIAAEHEAGFIEDSGKADERVNLRVEKLTRELLGSSAIDYQKFMAAMRQLVPPVPDEDGVICELSHCLPDTHFISLHGGYTSVHAICCGYPWNTVHSTESSFPEHAEVVRKLEMTRPEIWGVFPYKAALPERVKYAFFELPLGNSPWGSKALPKDKLIRAVIGTHFLGGGDHNMDYFRVNRFSEGHRLSLTNDVNEYLGLLLDIIEASS